jgi:hypothetical protein
VTEVTAPHPGDRVKLLAAGLSSVYIKIQAVKAYDSDYGWLVIVPCASRNLLREQPDWVEIYVVRDQNDDLEFFWRPSDHYKNG